MPRVQGDIESPSRSRVRKFALMVQVRESQCANQLSYHAGLESVLWIGPHQHLYYLWTKLGLRQGPVLLIQSCMTHTTQRSNRITGRSPDVDLILMMSQKPEISNRSITHCNEHLKVKVCGQRDILGDTLWHGTASTISCFQCVVVDILVGVVDGSMRVCVSMCVLFGGRRFAKVKGRYAGMGSWAGHRCIMWNSQKNQ